VAARWERYDLIAIDEVGYVPMAEPGAKFLWQVIAERAEKATVNFTTNRLCGSPHNKLLVTIVDPRS
jgi:DNA replication protein DnaC